MSKKKKVSVTALALFLPVFLWSASPVILENSPNMKALINGNNTFALDLYAQLRSTKGNLFFSPYSITTALAMTYAGARGNTAKQISNVLHFSLEQKSLHQTFHHLEAQLNAVKEKENIEFNVANGLWAQKDYRFLEEFFHLVTRNYNAELSYADFKMAYEAARQEINAWVEQRTNRRIKDLIKPGMLDSLTRLVLVNAIYFKGMWAIQFEKNATKETDFWVTPETKIDVPMMSTEHEFTYMDNDDVQVLELPYMGKELSMIILLPRKIDGLAQLEESLGVGMLDELLASLKKRNIKLYLPKFRISSEFSLASVLGSMGMPDAFDPNYADFSGIDGLRVLYISAVVHKAFVDVNEEGTEAAAATGVVVRITAAPVTPTVFRADHPFLFLIRDTRSGSLLFFGRVVNPANV
jgi:serine protease inhibitor